MKNTVVITDTDTALAAVSASQPMTTDRYWFEGFVSSPLPVLIPGRYGNS